jgi:hypothetical protein
MRVTHFSPVDLEMAIKYVGPGPHQVQDHFFSHTGLPKYFQPIFTNQQLAYTGNTINTGV